MAFLTKFRLLLFSFTFFFYDVSRYGDWYDVGGSEAGWIRVFNCGLLQGPLAPLDPPTQHVPNTTVE